MYCKEGCRKPVEAAAAMCAEDGQEACHGGGEQFGWQPWQPCSGFLTQLDSEAMGVLNN